MIIALPRHQQQHIIERIEPRPHAARPLLNAAMMAVIAELMRTVVLVMIPVRGLCLTDARPWEGYV